MMKQIYVNELLHNILVNEFAVYNSNMQVLMHPENCAMEYEMTEEQYKDFYKKTKTALINISKTANKIANELRYLEDVEYTPPKLVKKVNKSELNLETTLENKSNE